TYETRAQMDAATRRAQTPDAPVAVPAGSKVWSNFEESVAEGAKELGEVIPAWGKNLTADATNSLLSGATNITGIPGLIKSIEEGATEVTGDPSFGSRAGF